MGQLSILSDETCETIATDKVRITGEGGLTSQINNGLLFHEGSRLLWLTFQKATSYVTVCRTRHLYQLLVYRMSILILGVGTPEVEPTMTPKRQRHTVRSSFRDAKDTLS
jgi:hypothetical protein